MRKKISLRNYSFSLNSLLNHIEPSLKQMEHNIPSVIFLTFLTLFQLNIFHNHNLYYSTYFPKIKYIQLKTDKSDSASAFFSNQSSCSFFTLLKSVAKILFLFFIFKFFQNLLYFQFIFTTHIRS